MESEKEWRNEKERVASAAAASCSHRTGSVGLPTAWRNAHTKAQLRQASTSAGHSVGTSTRDDVVHQTHDDCASEPENEENE